MKLLVPLNNWRSDSSFKKNYSGTHLLLNIHWINQLYLEWQFVTRTANKSIFLIEDFISQGNKSIWHLNIFFKLINRTLLCTYVSAHRVQIWEVLILSYTMNICFKLTENWCTHTHTHIRRQSYRLVQDVWSLENMLLN